MEANIEKPCWTSVCVWCIQYDEICPSKADRWCNLRKHVFIFPRCVPSVSDLTATFWSSWSKRSTAELKPALWAKRITAEHRPVSIARWKSYLTLRRTDSVLCALRADWPYCEFTDCFKRYSRHSNVSSCAGAAALAGGRKHILLVCYFAFILCDT